MPRAFLTVFLAICVSTGDSRQYQFPSRRFTPPVCLSTTSHDSHLPSALPASPHVQLTTMNNTPLLHHTTADISITARNRTHPRSTRSTLYPVCRPSSAVRVCTIGPPESAMSRRIGMTLFWRRQRFRLWTWATFNAGMSQGPGARRIMSSIPILKGNEVRRVVPDHGILHRQQIRCIT